MKVKEQSLRANANATINSVVATLKKAKQIAQQNTFSLFTLEDKLITCDLARQWLLLHRTQELAKLKAEVAADVVIVFVASNVPAPPPPKVCCSPSEAPPSCAPALEFQGLGFASLNVDVVDDDDDCELDCDDVDESFHNDPHQELHRN